MCVELATLTLPIINDPVQAKYKCERKSAAQYPPMLNYVVSLDCRCALNINQCQQRQG